MKKLFAVGILALVFGSPVQAAWKVSRVVESGKKTSLSIQHVDRDVEEETPLRHLPLYLKEDAPPSKAIYEEILLPEDSIDSRDPAYTRFQRKAAPRWPGSEVRAIIVQGPPTNRINLTIVGDGYTMAEKQKFFDDAKRTADELFGATTYKSYLPLFNIYAVFVPSRDSGITDTQSRDTALGLYRDPKGSKRAIMPGNEQAADQALALAPGADFPILLANDDYYGGLGGKYAITTRSVESGAMVLRHELGHNFGEVGEEYDNAYVYTGANMSETSDVKWMPWVSGGKLRLSETQFLAGDYLWQNLSGGPIKSSFDFPAAESKGPYVFEVLISSVGWATPEDVYAYLDGNKVQMKGVYTADRSFFTLDLTSSLAPGSHTLEFRENIHDGDNVLAFAEVYAHSPDYDFTHDAIGGYATYDIYRNKAGYRPTRDACLMRNMRSKEFCAVDKENMWQRFIARVNLIDDVKVTPGAAGGERTVEVATPPLTGLSIHWYRIDAGIETELKDLADMPKWSAKAGLTGDYRVRVSLKTDEVRTYTNDFMRTKDFTL